jgi:iron complex transport system ATP-binding protein
MNDGAASATRLVGRDLTIGWNSRVVAQLPEVAVISGQILAIAGGNGVGKSTLIKTLARQLAPLQGRVLLNEQDIHRLPARFFAQQVAYVPQLIETPEGMTVQEMVNLGRNPHQIWWSWRTARQDQEAVERALRFTETVSLRNSLVGCLSGGERQRVALALALAQESRLLLLDEPTAHLDFKHQLDLVELLLSLRSEGLGFAIVLHDLNLIARLADRVLLLNSSDRNGSTGGAGVVAAYGTTDEVLNVDTLRAVYGVDVAINEDPGSGLKTYVPIRALNPAERLGPAQAG